MNFQLPFKKRDHPLDVVFPKTHHSEIQTPVFMPIGTQGVIKTIDPEVLDQLETQIVLANTYHLYLRPGHDLINRSGSLHHFMNWKKILY
ncbi:MAG: hypothetical protein CM1200mP1_09110 [Candidatus Neomarinimicrobiota bacterium]|nr:MAG: hypothetical protein CM1200mP1_09110 [Candidatus Neomarinimicrobiota bacterium]